MQSYGSVLVKDRDVAKHRAFEVQLFSAPRGSSDNKNDYPIRMVLSSYYFNATGSSYGIPDGKSDCSICREQCSTCQGSMPKTATATKQLANVAVDKISF